MSAFIKNAVYKNFTASGYINCKFLEWKQSHIDVASKDCVTKIHVGFLLNEQIAILATADETNEKYLRDMI